MNKTIGLALIAILVIVAIGGFIFIQSSSKSKKSMEQTDSMIKTSPTGATKDESMMQDDQSMMSSRYVSYTKSALDSSANTRRVLFFLANWCPTCIPADKNFQENSSQIPEDVTVIRVNYNDTETDQEEKDLAKKYGVTYQHTYVQIDENGNEVTKWNGGQLPELLSKIK